MENIGKRLKTLREFAGLNQQQIAEVINKNRSTYAYYETGTTMPSVTTLKTIAGIYNMSLDELVDGVEAGNVVNAPETPYEDNWNTDDKFNQLSRFEKSILLKIRLMSIEEKQELLDFLNK